MNRESPRQSLGKRSTGVSDFGSLLHRGSAVGDLGFAVGPPGPEQGRSVYEFSAPGSAATGRNGGQSPPALGYDR
jgi:hypothetical protein